MEKLLEDGQQWAAYHGDCIPHMMNEMPPQSVDFCICSIPFPAVYSYTNLPEDIGNSENLLREGKIHFGYFYRALKTVLKPGRIAIIHVQQIIRMKRTGGDGMFDFRGLNIRIAERAGLIYEYDWMIRKGPQQQALRTRSRELQFAGLESDRSNSRGAMCDYLLKFTAPGVNQVKIDNEGEVSRNDWIRYAEGCWDDIQESDTLNTAAAKSEDDTRHICPLQILPIQRCTLLFSRPGEIVFSPFMGIASEGHAALGGKSPKTGFIIANPRRFYGCEIKGEYYEQGCKNLAKAESVRNELESNSLFDEPELQATEK